MSINSWLQNLRSALAPDRGQRKHRRRGSLRAATPRLNLEVLEDRCLLSFTTPTHYAVAEFSACLAVGDFNGDGRSDVVAAQNPYSRSVAVLLSNGDGTLHTPTYNDVGVEQQYSVAVGDITGDGRDDYYVRNHAVALGDLNNDGYLDVIQMTSGIDNGGEEGYPTPGKLTVELGNGDGTFSFPVEEIDYGFTNLSVAVGDMDGDGNRDVIALTAEDDGPKIFFGNSDGTLWDGAAPWPVGTYTNPRALTVADFDSDGDLDLATVNGGNDFVGPLAFPPSVNVLLNRGDGRSFQHIGPYSLGALPGSIPNSDIATADFNRDGKLDLVATNDSSSISVLLGNGDGTFQNARFFDAGGRQYHVAVADLNGDNYPDVITDSGARVTVLINDGIWAPPPPSITLRDVSVNEGNSGTRSATFTVTLSAEYGQPVSVAYATANGSATAGSDYQPASDTLIIPAGQTTGTITVLVIGDRLGEANETFVVNLSNATNATIADGQAVGNIVDDEPRISIGDVSKYEGKKGKTTLFTFTVTLSAAYDQPVTMSYRTVNGTATTSDNDYVAKNGTLTFAPGETMKTITIEVKGDSKREANETFYLDLFGNSSNALFTKNRGLGTILNDD